MKTHPLCTRSQQETVTTESRDVISSARRQYSPTSDEPLSGVRNEHLSEENAMKSFRALAVFLVVLAPLVAQAAPTDLSKKTPHETHTAAQLSGEQSAIADAEVLARDLSGSAADPTQEAAPRQMAPEFSWPEPPNYAVILAALGAIGFMARRRRPR
jgi:hypothetical protein